MIYKHYGVLMLPFMYKEKNPTWICLMFQKDAYENRILDGIFMEIINDYYMTEIKFQEDGSCIWLKYPANHVQKLKIQVSSVSLAHYFQWGK